MKILVVLFSFFACALGAQIQDNDKKFIEVTGTGEIEVVPDEIFVTIMLQESREKDALSKQEEALKRHVKELGIDAQNLTLNSADADYRQFRAFKKEVVLTKTYILKLSNVSILTQLYDRLDKMNAHDAYVSKINNSKIIEHAKEARVKAIKAAKEKAEYLLAAIGSQAGSPLQVTEMENYIHNPMYRNIEKKVSNIRVLDTYESGEEEMSFRKIIIKSSIHVKFEIK
jgi:uncharacterized protein